MGENHKGHVRYKRKYLCCVALTAFQTFFCWKPSRRPHKFPYQNQHNNGRNYDLIKCIDFLRSRHSRLSSRLLCDNENVNMTCDVLLSFSTYRSNGISSRNSFILDRIYSFHFEGWHDMFSCLIRKRQNKLSVRNERLVSSFDRKKGRILLLFIRWENLSLIIRIRNEYEICFFGSSGSYHTRHLSVDQKHARRIEANFIKVELLQGSLYRSFARFRLIAFDMRTFLLINVTSKIDKFLHSRLNEFLHKTFFRD